MRYRTHPASGGGEGGGNVPRSSIKMQHAGGLARVTFGFVMQLLSTYTSISVFVDEGKTCYLWTGMAVAMGLMLWTPSERLLERYSHVVSGVLAYWILDYHYERFPTGLVLCTAFSNALGQVVGEASMRRVHSATTPLIHRDVQRPGFLSALMMCPVVLGSVVASVPGSLGFHLVLGANLREVFENYSMGHISGTAVVLYPILVLPALWSHRQPLRSTALPVFLSLVGIAFMFSFENYGVFAFAAIIGTFFFIVSASTILDQWSACLMEAVATALILGLTAGKRGPVHSIYSDQDPRDVLLSTQLTVATATVCGAFVCISSTRLRLLQASEKGALDKAEQMIETQTLQLCRVGHDMLNNSALIWSMTESMAEDLPATGCAGDQLKSIQAATTMNGTLVKDMVDLFRPNGMSGAVNRTEVDLRELMDMHVKFAKALARMAGKSLDATLDMEGTIMLFTDKDRLHQVLSNLVGNAVKYTVSGTITLRATRHRRCDDRTAATATDSVTLQVADTGIGIDAEDIPKIFGFLFRCDRGTKVATGTGLGLSSVQDSCRLLGAEITVASPGINQGSTFTLKFPEGACLDDNAGATTKKEQDEGTEESGQTVSTAGIRALVCDDSRVIREMMKRYLIGLGCDVVAFESGEQAKEHLLRAADAIDVVITDHHMGEGFCTGAEIISDIRLGRLLGVSTDKLCILCSGMETQIEEYGENTFFMWKPFTREGIANVLRAVAQRIAVADPERLGKC